MNKVVLLLIHVKLKEIIMYMKTYVMKFAHQELTNQVKIA